MRRMLTLAAAALAVLAFSFGSASLVRAEDPAKNAVDASKSGMEKAGKAVEEGTEKAWDETKKETKDADEHVKTHTEKDWDSVTYKDSTGEKAAPPDAGASKKGETEGK
jgi:hypothetical protein